VNQTHKEEAGKVFIKKKYRENEDKKWKKRDVLFLC